MSKEKLNPVLSLIVAVGENHAIGGNGKLLWHLPNDLKHFKSVTQGHTVIMGRKTFESLPNGALPNRRNIVISRNNNFTAPDIEVSTSVDKALELTQNESEVFIIGGGNIYRQTIDIADKLYITVIRHTFENADTFFPQIKTDEWKEICSEFHGADEENIYNYTFKTYIRR